MPSPKQDDPMLCPSSGSTNYAVQNGWIVCSACTRVLKPVKEGPNTQRGLEGKALMRAHRVRSRTTASLDKLRDSLLSYNIGTHEFDALNARSDSTP